MKKAPRVAAGRSGARSGPAAALPAMRDMSVIAQDPTVCRPNGDILMAKICVPAEDLVAGPVGYRLQVVDYDSTTRVFNGAHQLPSKYTQEPAAWTKGRPGIVKDYRFHAQNVYALVMKTLARFEFALGRRIGWSFGTHQLKVAPHGMLDANAFYSPREEGLVFGYFPGRKGTVFTCLSHDVVVHETTHALIDAMRERYMDPSSPDQAAFHEGLADVIALLSVFSQPELLRMLLGSTGRGSAPAALISSQKVKAEALRQSALFGLAEEMGQEMQGARGSALRHSASIPPQEGILDELEFQEAHRRGEVLVAAVMNGFIEAWAARIEGLGGPGQRAYPLARVAEEGADIADALATMWIRGLDYMPPVHVEFADALSGALTADMEVRPDDGRFSLRKHILQSFRAYGIEPAGKGGEEPGVWRRAPTGLNYERVRFESMRSDKDEVFRFIWDHRERLELRDGAYTEVLSVRPCVRIGPDGFTLRETVVEYYQVARLTPEELRRVGVALPEDYVAELRKEEAAIRARRARTRPAAEPGDGEAGDMDDGADGDDLTTPIYGGAVLIFDEYGQLKYRVHNDVFGGRQAGRLQYLWDTGQLAVGRDGSRLRAARLSTIHRLRAIDARRFPAEGW
jgi:hypothetical protein